MDYIIRLNAFGKKGKKKREEKKKKTVKKKKKKMRPFSNIPEELAFSDLSKEIFLAGIF